MRKVVVKVGMGFIVFFLYVLFELDPDDSDRWVVSHVDCVYRV